MEERPKLFRQLSDQGRALFLDALGSPNITSKSYSSMSGNGGSFSSNNNKSYSTDGVSSSLSNTANASSSASNIGISLSPSSPGATHYSPQLRAYPSTGMTSRGSFLQGAASLVGDSPALKSYRMSSSLSSYDQTGFSSLDSIDAAPLIPIKVIIRWKVPRVAKHGSMAFEIVCNESKYHQYKQQETMSVSQKAARKSRNQYINPHDVIADQDSENVIFLDARRGIHASHSDIQLATQALLHSETTTFSLSTEELLEHILRNGEVIG